MMRTRLAQAAAVATLAIGSVVLVGTVGTAGAAPSVSAGADGPAPIATPTASVSPDNLTWG